MKRSDGEEVKNEYERMTFLKIFLSVTNNNLCYVCGCEEGITAILYLCIVT